MSVRRRQHVFNDADTGSFSSLLEITRDASGSRRRCELAPTTLLPPNYPALTTFGPQPLADFVRERCRIDGDQIAGTGLSSKGKGKGKDDAPTTTQTGPQRSTSPMQGRLANGGALERIHDLMARDAQARDSVQPARISLATNAIEHLHRQQDLHDSLGCTTSTQPDQDSPKKRRNVRKNSRKQPLVDFDPDSNVTSPDANGFLPQSTRPPRRAAALLADSRLRQPNIPVGDGGPISNRVVVRRRGSTTMRFLFGARDDNTTTSDDDDNDWGAVAPHASANNAGMGPRSSNRRPFGATRRMMRAISAGFTVPDVDDNGLGESTVHIRNTASHLESSGSRAIVPYNYASIVPTQIPRIAIRDRPQPASSAARSKRQRMPFGSRYTAPSDPDDDDSGGDSGSDWDSANFFSPNSKELSIPDDSSDRVWYGGGLPAAPGAPPECPLPTGDAYQMPDLPSDIWIAIAEYLSLPDIHALRLVSTTISAAMPTIQFRSLAAPFAPALQAMAADHHTSILAKHGPEIKKFGISFEYNAEALAFAAPKTSLKTEEAWYGSYQWPAEQYHRYESLKQLEDLVDNNTPILKDILGQLLTTGELGLAVDSGHGWLEGPDVSDMALFKIRQTKGSKIFGQAFGNEPAWQAYGRDEYFKWAQQNTINELIRHLAARSGTSDVLKMIEIVRAFQVRERNSFKGVQSQPDYNADSHTGGRAPTVTAAGVGPGPGPGPAPPGAPGAPWMAMQAQQLGAAPHLPIFNHHAGGPAAPMVPLNAFAWHAQAQPPNVLHQHQAQAQAQTQQIQVAALQQLALGGGAHGPPPVPVLFGSPLQSTERLRPRPRTASISKKTKPRHKDRAIPLQWPLIFNGYNLAAEAGGCLSSVQARIADPSRYALRPGSLTEAQVQWLMETIWAQRTFLSAYTNAIISNSAKLTHVHTLTIGKLSSGLLPSLGQPKFWDALPCLRRLKLLVSPDWRKEHREQDVFVPGWSLISPLDAVGKFAQFLRTHICRLERLSHASFGWVGGGEHAVGICARNQHLLPAPIVETPRDWISDHDDNFKGDPATMLKFKHLRDLTFENCWFSPFMLETFMKKSHDTSLHTLTLNSVSMLARHSTSLQTQSLTTIGDNLGCLHADHDWQQEHIPASATWTEVLDAITPGKTLLEHKYEAGMIDRDVEPMPKRSYRGNLQRIVLKSCGYAMIEGIKSELFNQRDLVTQPMGSTDVGLKAREAILRGRVFVTSHDIRSSASSTTYGTAGLEGDQAIWRVDVGALMLGTKDAANSRHWQGLGRLTQCVHPIEKRVLEQAWGMEFGWGDDLDRWAAVEDAQLEGGTGRFSGIIVSDGLDDEDGDD